MASTMSLTINNLPTSGAPSDQVYVCLLGNDPSAPDTSFGYLDFATGQAVFSDKTSWAMDSATMATTLDQITFPLAVPDINSGRIYFSVGAPFPAFPASGPTASKDNATLFDKIEFDSGSNPNINGTSVDFYGISYVISGTDVNDGAVQYGFDKSRSEIIGALTSIPASTPTTQESGNTGIFAQTVVEGAAAKAETPILRVLAPKTMGLSDWGATEKEFVFWATACSHFLDAYVTQHCFRPNRAFSFFDKTYTPAGPNTTYYGTTDADGTLSLWTDAAHTQPYTPVPTLAPPCAPWPLPSMKPPPPHVPSNYHNVNGTQDEIDWGFLLLGNSVGTGAADHWGNDPLCMAIMVSICRGVMHLDDGTTSWVDASQYYQGAGVPTSDTDAPLPPVSTEDLPIFYYASVLHEKGLDGKAYVLSYDDVYGSNPSIFFAGHPDVTIDLHGLDTVMA